MTALNEYATELEARAAALEHREKDVVALQRHASQLEAYTSQLEKRLLGLEKPRFSEHLSTVADHDRECVQMLLGLTKGPSENSKLFEDVSRWEQMLRRF